MGKPWNRNGIYEEEEEEEDGEGKLKEKWKMALAEGINTYATNAVSIESGGVRNIGKSPRNFF